jgi:hypothetical protein
VVTLISNNISHRVMHIAISTGRKPRKMETHKTGIHCSNLYYAAKCPELRHSPPCGPSHHHVR